MEYIGTINYSREITNHGKVYYPGGDFHAFKVIVTDISTGKAQFIGFFCSLAMAVTWSQRIMNQLELDREVIERQQAAWQQACLPLE